VIVVIGHPVARSTADGRRPAGTAALAAIEAARGGATVQLVGKIGDDAAGDEVVLALADAGVGHVALLRDPARPTPLLIEGVETEDLDTGDETTVALIEPVDPERRPTLDAADVELGLRYLAEFRAIVVAEPLPDAVLRVAADAAAYVGAELILVTADAARPSLDLPADALVIGSGGDEGGALASLLGRVAAAVDSGTPATEALSATVGVLGATRAD
jgi:sugar/nucleoside kinase (ribokinase family)